jgi:uncharacterized membrane protein YhaH (DUF805 family)
MQKHSKLIQIIGWSGTIVLIVAYALNSFGFIPSQGLLYPLLNIYAAIALGVRVWVDRNYSNVILEVFWAGVAVLSLIKFLV